MSNQTSCNVDLTILISILNDKKSCRVESFDIRHGD